MYRIASWHCLLALSHLWTSLFRVLIREGKIQVKFTTAFQKKVKPQQLFQSFLNETLVSSPQTKCHMQPDRPWMSSVCIMKPHSRKPVKVVWRFKPSIRPDHDLFTPVFWHCLEVCDGHPRVEVSNSSNIPENKLVKGGCSGGRLNTAMARLECWVEKGVNLHNIVTSNFACWSWRLNEESDSQTGENK